MTEPDVVSASAEFDLLQVLGIVDIVPGFPNDDNNNNHNNGNNVPAISVSRNFRPISQPIAKDKEEEEDEKNEKSSGVLPDFSQTTPFHVSTPLEQMSQYSRREREKEMKEKELERERARRKKEEEEARLNEEREKQEREKLKKLKEQREREKEQKEKELQQNLKEQLEKERQREKEKPNKDNNSNINHSNQTRMTPRGAPSRVNIPSADDNASFGIIRSQEQINQFLNRTSSQSLPQNNDEDLLVLDDDPIPLIVPVPSESAAQPLQKKSKKRFLDD